MQAVRLAADAPIALRLSPPCIAFYSPPFTDLSSSTSLLLMGCTPSRVQPGTVPSVTVINPAPDSQPPATSSSSASSSAPSKASTLSVPLLPAPTRTSILKQPGKKKDFDAIRAKKQLHTASASAGHPPPSSPLKAVKNAFEEETQVEEVKEETPALPPAPQEEKEAGEGGGSLPPTSSYSSQSADVNRQGSFKGGKRSKRRTSHQGMMAKLALQFPAIRESFSAVYTSFSQFCQRQASSTTGTTGAGRVMRASVAAPSVSGLGSISLDQLPAFLAHLTHHSHTFTSADVTRLFDVSHTTHSPTLTFREVLIAVALGYYLAPPTVPSPAVTDPTWGTVGHGFRLIEKAFNEIDDDGSGMLSAAEMKQALFATSGVKGVGGGGEGGGKVDERDQGTLDMRFKELDINGDGDVEFKEFLYGVVSWVGMTSEDAEELSGD